MDVPHSSKRHNKDNSGSKKGLIYILSNPSIRYGIYKIGYTARSMEERIKELNKSNSLPTAFSIEAYFEVDLPKHLEKKLHHRLRKYRVSHKEYFKLTLDDAIKTISTVCETRPKSINLKKELEIIQRLKKGKIIPPITVFESAVSLIRVFLPLLIPLFIAFIFWLVAALSDRR